MPCHIPHWSPDIFLAGMHTGCPESNRGQFLKKFLIPLVISSMEKAMDAKVNSHVCRLHIFLEGGVRSLLTEA